MCKKIMWNIVNIYWTIMQSNIVYLKILRSPKFIAQSLEGKGKGKVLPITDHEGPEGEQMYSSTLP